MILDFIIWLSEKVRERAREELEDTPEKLKKELLDNQLLMELDQISDEEYKKREDDILARLNALKEETEKQ